MRVLNKSQSTILGENVSLANTFLTRTLGLIPRKSIFVGEGLIIDPCNSIHMFFMRFPIDVIFVDGNNVVVFTVKNIKPWRATRIVWNAKFVIELPPGTVEKTNTKIGDKIEIL